MRVGQSIWHSSRINEDNAEISEFSEPTEITTRFNYFTVMPATSRGFMEVVKYGEDVDSTWTAIANANAFGANHGFILGESLLGSRDVLSKTNYFERIKIGDVFWLDGERPNAKLEAEYGVGSTATAIVKSVNHVNLSISITLTRNKDQVKQ